jgi:hypothetical protein
MMISSVKNDLYHVIILNREYLKVYFYNTNTLTITNKTKMNGAHLHLILNHFPIIGTYLSFAVLTYGLARKNNSVRMTGLSLMILTSIFAIPAFLTGEPAEEIVKAGRLANNSFIHAHEEMAEAAMWMCEITGVLALLTMIFSLRNHKLTRLLSIVVLSAMLICSFMWFRVGNSGGEIRHTEIRNNVGTED